MLRILLLKFDSSRRFISLCGFEIWWMTSSNNRTSLLLYIRLCASFQIHWWIHTGVTVRKRSIRVKMGIFMSRVTLKFEGWPWKIKGHLFFTTPSFVHHFTAIGEFKLELHPFFTLEIWWITLNKANLRDLIAATGLVISLKLDSNHWFFIRVALRFDSWPRRNNRAHLLYYVKFCASFQSHGWIQTGVTVRKRIILVNVGDFYPVWTWNLTNNLEKQ